MKGHYKSMAEIKAIKNIDDSKRLLMLQFSYYN